MTEDEFNEQFTRFDFGKISNFGKGRPGVVMLGNECPNRALVIDVGPAELSAIETARDNAPAGEPTDSRMAIITDLVDGTYRSCMVSALAAIDMATPTRTAETLAEAITRSLPVLVDKDVVDRSVHPRRVVKPGVLGTLPQSQPAVASFPFSGSPTRHAVRRAVAWLALEQGTNRTK